MEPRKANRLKSQLASQLLHQNKKLAYWLALKFPLTRISVPLNLTILRKNIATLAIEQQYSTFKKAIEQNSRFTTVDISSMVGDERSRFCDG